MTEVDRSPGQELISLGSGCCDVPEIFIFAKKKGLKSVLFRSRSSVG